MWFCCLENQVSHLFLFIKPKLMNSKFNCLWEIIVKTHFILLLLTISLSICEQVNRCVTYTPKTTFTVTVVQAKQSFHVTVFHPSKAIV